MSPRWIIAWTDGTGSPVNWAYSRTRTAVRYFRFSGARGTGSIFLLVATVCLALPLSGRLLPDVCPGVPTGRSVGKTSLGAGQIDHGLAGKRNLRRRLNRRLLRYHQAVAPGEDFLQVGRHQPADVR